MAARKRVHLISTVNASAVTKAGDTYTIRDVCGAVDEIVMNGMLYPGDQLAAAAPGLTGKPAPAGHPKNSAGQFISAVNGEALLSAYIGSVCTNARHTGGRTLVDIVVNSKQAAATDAGTNLLARLDAALDGTNVEPIHVSTGLFCEAINASGESGGRSYSRIATKIDYDHLAILLNEQGAGTPADGVGMFLNSAGDAEAVDVGRINTDPEDKRAAGLKAWLLRLLGNAGSAEVSFDEISSGLFALMPRDAWVREVFDTYCIWCDAGRRLWKQDYTVSAGGSVAFSSEPVEVRRKVNYETVTNHRKEDDPMKDKILAALNAAGIKTDGLDESGLLEAYNQLVTKPVSDKLTAANSKLAEAEAAGKAAEAAEVDTLSKELATNSDLTVDDFKALGLERLRALKAKAKAAPVIPGATGSKGDDQYSGYSLNSFIDAKQAA